MRYSWLIKSSFIYPIWGIFSEYTPFGVYSYLTTNLGCIFILQPVWLVFLFYIPLEMYLILTP